MIPRVVLIEDHNETRENWDFFLRKSKQVELVKSYSNCSDAMNESYISTCHILLLDIHLPGISGIDAIPGFFEQNSTIKIILFTVSENEKDIDLALQSGAAGYLLKDLPPQKMIEHILETYNGGAVLSPKVAKTVMGKFSKRPIQDIPELNTIERKILLLLCKGNSYKSMGRELFLSKDGISYHLRKIYQKLKVKNRHEAVIEAISMQLVDL